MNTCFVSTPSAVPIRPADDQDQDQGDDDQGGNKWADAAWEIAVTVIGGVLVAGLSTVLVLWINTRSSAGDTGVG